MSRQQERSRIARQPAESWPRCADDTGANVVEYILLISFVALIVLGAVKVLGHTTSSKFEDAASVVGGGTVPTTLVTSAADGSGGGGSGGPGGGVGASSPTTTVAGSTTTTTIPAPTTTVPPTTVPSATKVAAAFASPTATKSGSDWNASANTAVTDDLGHPVAGAVVTVTVREYTEGHHRKYSWVTSTQHVTTGYDGTVSVFAGPYKRHGAGRVSRIELVVKGVTLPSGLPWDGTAASVVIDRV